MSRQTPSLWWLLCGGGLVSANCAFDDIGIHRALRKEVNRTQRRSTLLEYVDKFFTHDAPLLLRVYHAAKTSQEPVGSVHILDTNLEIVGKSVEDSFGLLAPKGPLL